MRRTELRRARGFTLAEIIVVMVVLGIVSSMVAVFIVAPALGYRDSVARAELTDIADTTLRRMAREIRLALPNSVRVSADGKTIEMLVTRTGGRYLAAEDGAATTEPILDFTRSTSTTFRLVGQVPLGKEAISVGDRVVVYNLGNGIAGADAYDGGNSAAVAGVSGNVITMASNPFATQDPPMPSPTNRFQVVARVVRYVCDTTNHTLTRRTGYTWTTGVDSTPGDGTASLAANRVEACLFEYTDLANTRTGLVSLSLTLRNHNSSDDSGVRLLYQVHVNNSP